jgi:CspA family cold shock protein
VRRVFIFQLGRRIMNGVVKRLVRDKGFGFIVGEGGMEYFFHRSAVEDFEDLEEKDRVTFKAGNGPKGPRAEDVQRQS